MTTQPVTTQAAQAIRVHGFGVATQPASVRESISLAGQFAAVDETLTGRENLVLVARLPNGSDDVSTGSPGSPSPTTARRPIRWAVVPAH